MNLLVASSYLSDADEVVVDFRSNLSNVPTVADTVVFVLSSRTENLLGAETFSPLATITADSSYIQEEKNYLVRFRNPKRKMDLWMDVTATYSSIPYTAHVQVGAPLPAQDKMDLPSNEIFERDPFSVAPTGGPTELPNQNVAILAPEIQDFVQTFDFTMSHAPEDFAPPLTYAGGGNRLLLNNQTNKYILQLLNAPYWDVNTTHDTAFAFLEDAATNLMPNPFFLSLTGSSPSGYAVDSAGSLLTETVSFDFSTSSDAQLWALRFRQNNIVSAFNQVTINALANIPITANQSYTYSVYARIRGLNKTTIVTGMTLALRWFDGSNAFISESTVNIPTANVQVLNLISLTDTAPLNAASVLPVIRMGSVDPGDDIELSLFGIQLETGPFPTSRVTGSRIQDLLSVSDYNASNQRIRLELIPGFASGSGITRQFFQGPVNVSFTSTGMLFAEIPLQGNVQAPVAFSAGDLVDITIEHQSGKSIAIYRDGQLLAQTPLPTFVSTLAPLSILGVGVEVLKFSVFSRE